MSSRVTTITKSYALTKGRQSRLQALAREVRTPLLIGTPVGFCLGLSKAFTKPFDPLVLRARVIELLASGRHAAVTVEGPAELKSGWEVQAPADATPSVTDAVSPAVVATAYEAVPVPEPDAEARSEAVASAADLKLLSAGAARPLLQYLIPEFEKETGNKVSSAWFGPPHIIKNRIVGGEAVDIVF